MTPILEARGLSAGYDTSRILRGVDLVLPAGEAIGLMGGDGMGKTTLGRTLIGLLPAREGSVFLDGADAAALPVFEQARRGGAGKSRHFREPVHRGPGRRAGQGHGGA
jgi:ABC-type branched-subunit amino acid transport system ATPase component